MSKVLTLCTGNSCRNQMAEGFLKSFDQNLDVYSADIYPTEQIHPKAAQVLKETGIDLSRNSPKSVDEFLDESFQLVISGCGGAKESCPTFMGKVDHRKHIGFEDPADATGTEEGISAVFRKVRDEIRV